MPVLGLILMGSNVERQNKSAGDLKDMGAVPPGIFRAAVIEEWAAFLERMDRR
jgi:hypothetical protein